MFGTSAMYQPQVSREARNERHDNVYTKFLLFIVGAQDALVEEVTNPVADLLVVTARNEELILQRQEYVRQGSLDRFFALY